MRDMLIADRDASLIQYNALEAQANALLATPESAERDRQIWQIEEHRDLVGAHLDHLAMTLRRIDGAQTTAEAA